MEKMDSSTLYAELERLMPTAQTLLVAVSGGGDSVALLRLLHGGPYNLHVAHFDHALRPESAAEAQFVEELCETIGVPLTVKRTEVRRVAEAKRWNLEDAARRLRYSFLLRTAKRIGADAVVTAHTQDDEAETVLMQLLRGSAFLRGMHERQANIVRPLLGTTRSALRDYLETLGQTWLEDSSNSDLTRTRAWLRHEVLPILKQRYPTVQKALIRHARVQRGASSYLETQARPLVGAGGLNVASIRQVPEALALTALKLLLQDAGVAPELERLEHLRSVLDEVHPLRLSLPNNKTVRLAYGRLELVQTSRAREPRAAEVALTLPADIAAERLDNAPLYYRTRSPGDWIRLPGGRKKLSDLLIDAKIFREARDALRLLATSSVGPSEILWVEGVATSVRVARPRTAVQEDDTRFMKRALELARVAAEAGEVPVGAVIVLSGEILAEGRNTTRRDGDPTAHAELQAIRRAAHRLGDWRLAGCTLYVTLEPCPMCFGAMLAAHLPQLVYGAVNRREGAAGGVADLQQHDWKRNLAVRHGVLAEEASELLSAFFDSRRTTANPPDAS